MYYPILKNPIIQNNTTDNKWKDGITIFIRNSLQYEAFFLSKQDVGMTEVWGWGTREKGAGINVLHVMYVLVSSSEFIRRNLKAYIWI